MHRTTPLPAVDGGAGGLPLPVLLGGFVLAGLLGAVVTAVRTRRQQAATRKSAETALREHHRVRWQADPATFVARPEHWTLAVGAPFSLCQESPWDALRSTNPEVGDILAEAWGVRSRAQLLSTLHWLLTEGHRVGMTAERAHWAAMDDATAAEAEAAQRPHAERSDDAAEVLWRFRRVRANDRGIRAVDFTAWDHVRFVMLARAGATLGYVSDAEAQDFLLMVADDLRAAYPSWKDLGGHFLVARWYWAAQGGAAEQENDRHDQSRQQALLGPDGPWSHVPWDLATPASCMLFVDALVAEDLLEPLDDEDLATATPWSLRLDAVVRERAGLPPRTAP